MDQALHLTMSNEDYLEKILQLSAHSEKVRSVDIADGLGVSKASVSKAMGVLRSQGLIEQEHYGLITLTDKGHQAARGVLCKHTMIKSFLVHVLHVSEAVAEDDACKMEHVISEETQSKWYHYMRSMNLADESCKVYFNPSKAEKTSCVTCMGYDDKMDEEESH